MKSGRALRLIHDSERPVELSPEEDSWVTTAYNWLTLYEGMHEGFSIIEEPVCPGTAFGCPDELWGTPDYVFVNWRDSLVFVVDAKFGYVEVGAEGNLQLLLYTIGVAEAYDWAFERYAIAIIQPQVSPMPKLEILTREELLNETRKLQGRVSRALQNEAALVPTQTGCALCPAAATCPALKEQTAIWAQRAFHRPETIDPEVLASLLERAPMIRKALDAMEAYALKRLEIGSQIPGWKRVASKGHRKWNDDEEAERVLALLVEDSDALWKREFISPNQAEKLLKVPRKTVDSLTHKPEGSPMLVRDSDPRPALDSAFRRLELEGHEEEDDNGK